MNLFENLQIMREMAYERRKVIDKFQNNNENRIYHLLYIFFFRNDKSLKHWLDEVEAFTEYSYRVKPKNKLLSSKEIYDLIWLQPKDMINEKSVKTFLEIAYRKKDLPLITSYSLDNLLNYLTEFFKWVSKELSENDIVGDIDIKIKELLNKYPIES